MRWRLVRPWLIWFITPWFVILSAFIPVPAKWRMAVSYDLQRLIQTNQFKLDARAE
jgi:hypothetical protein